MDRLFVYLTDLSGSVAYAIIFGILVACGLGLPLPEDIPLVAAGYLVWDGTLSVWGTLLVTLTGVLIGDTILFWLGRKFGMKLLDPRRKKPFFPPDRVHRVKAYFRKYGEKIVFFARFVAGFRAVAFFMAGAMKMPYQHFILFDGLAALVSVPIWIGLGYGLGHYFGDEISQILANLRNFKTGFSILVGVALLIFAVKMFRRYQQAKKAAAKAAAHSIVP